jgi:glycolate oxidase iron-sulfur subunit
VPDAASNVFARAGADADLDRFLGELQKCVRCGQCRASCPVFREFLAETDVARGKLGLLSHYLLGGATPDRRVYGRLTRCVNCGRCKLECPSGADTGYVMLEGRMRLGRLVGLPPLKRLILRGLFGNQRRLRLAAAMLRSAQPLFFRALRADPRLVRSVWRLPVLGQRVVLPRLRRTPGAAAAPGARPAPVAAPRATGRVVLYPGCLAELAYPELIEATGRVYRQLGLEVSLPAGLACCGAPAAYAGDVDSARRLAAANLRTVWPLLAGDPSAKLVFVCPSCAVAFKHDYPVYLFGKLSGGRQAAEDLGLGREELELVAGRVEDAATLAWRLGAGKLLPRAPGPGQALPGLPGTVTYHDPCHLRRLLAVTAEPRETLWALVGQGYKEAPNPDSCCGFGGTFALEHSRASGMLLERRSRELAGTGAEAVATACPGCMAWLSNGLDRVGSPRRTVHLIELLAEGLAGV